MIQINSTGDFSKTLKFLSKITKIDLQMKILEKYGKQGVQALAAATPVKTGRTASSWNYEIEKLKDGYAIRFTNSNINKYANVAILLQYGHATKNGGYVQGRDYINPAIRPIFEKLSKEAWEEVVKT